VAPKVSSIFQTKVQNFGKNKNIGEHSTSNFSSNSFWEIVFGKFQRQQNIDENFAKSFGKILRVQNVTK